MELDRLLQRLRGRLGETAVIRPERVESYLPERTGMRQRMNLWNWSRQHPGRLLCCRFPVRFEWCVNHRTIGLAGRISLRIEETCIGWRR